MTVTKNDNPTSSKGNGREPEFITVADVVTMVSCSERTVRGWIADGTLPAFKAGRMVRIRRADAAAIFKPLVRN